MAASTSGLSEKSAANRRRNRHSPALAGLPPFLNIWGFEPPSALCAPTPDPTRGYPPLDPDQRALDQYVSCASHPKRPGLCLPLPTDTCLVWPRSGQTNTRVKGLGPCGVKGEEPSWGLGQSPISRAVIPVGTLPQWLEPLLGSSMRCCGEPILKFWLPSSPVRPSLPQLSLRVRLSLPVPLSLLRPSSPQRPASPQLSFSRLEKATD